MIGFRRNFRFTRPVATSLTVLLAASATSGSAPQELRDPSAWLDDSKPSEALVPRPALRDVSIDVAQIGKIADGKVTIRYTFKSDKQRALPQTDDPSDCQSSSAIRVIIVDGKGQRVPEFCGFDHRPDIELLPDQPHQHEVTYESELLKNVDAERNLIHFMWATLPGSAFGDRGGAFELR